MCRIILLILIWQVGLFTTGCNEKTGISIGSSSISGSNYFSEDAGNSNNHIYNEESDIDSVFLRNYLNEQNASENLSDQILHFYQNRNYRFAWVNGNKLKPQLQQLIHRVKNSGADGLFPNDYKLPATEDLNNKRLSDDEKAALDAAATLLYFHFASDMKLGRIDPKQAQINWNVRARDEVQLGQLLETILDNKNANDPFAVLEPKHKDYQILKKHLHTLSEIKRNGGWEKLVLENSSLEKGDSSSVIIKLKNRLTISGDYVLKQENLHNANVFDESLEEAVKRFQIKHGLEQDGVVGGNTLAALNVSVEERMHQVKINMERWRWVPEDLGYKYVKVNIPTYELFAVENNRVHLNMKVITGTELLATPIFMDTIEYLVFSPYWHVPKSIAVRKYLDKIKSDPSFLSRNNMYITSINSTTPINPYAINWSSMNSSNFNYTIHQRPGRNNALGQVKFIFPNKNNIYLHDTPDDHLFERNSRGFSNGCIRIERPLEMAEFLLKDNSQYWDKEIIDQHMNKSSDTRVNLENKVPVYIFYFTVTSKEGEIYFGDDIYGHDKDLKNIYFSYSNYSGNSNK